MLRFYSSDYGIIEGECSLNKINKLFAAISGFSGEKELIFQKGIYHFCIDETLQLNLHMSNTISEQELLENNLGSNKTVGLFLENISNLKILGNDSTFVFYGKLTHMVMLNCNDITLKNLHFTNYNPDCHTITIFKKTPFSFDFIVDRYSKLIQEGEFFWKGDNFYTPVLKAPSNKWISYSPADSSHIHRKANPFNKISLLTKSLLLEEFRAKLFPHKFKLKDRLTLFSNLRDCTGVFLDSCKNIFFENFKQSFNYSIGILAQNSESLSFINLDFSPREDNYLTSIADFLHFSMCRGSIIISNSKFVGSGDDVLNVHGINFKIIKRLDNKIIVRFMHPQTYGFNPFLTGDTIAFINSKSLQTYGKSRVISSRLINLYEIELKIDEVLREGDYIQNVSCNPDLFFFDNLIDRVATRGLLLTSSGKIEIYNNCFKNISMSAILVANDATNWFESGSVEDLKIYNNDFINVKGYCVEVKPSCKYNGIPVHSGILITDNTFYYEGKNPIIYISCSENVIINKNHLYSKTVTKEHVLLSNSNNVEIM